MGRKVSLPHSCTCGLMLPGAAAKPYLSPALPCACSITTCPAELDAGCSSALVSASCSHQQHDLLAGRPRQKSPTCGTSLHEAPKTTLIGKYRSSLQRAESCQQACLSEIPTTSGCWSHLTVSVPHTAQGAAAMPPPLDPAQLRIATDSNTVHGQQLQRICPRTTLTMMG